MLGIYFSGNGNTKFCVETFVHCIDETATCVSIEDNNVIDYLQESNEIILGYPIYYSNIPVFVREFINDNGDFFKEKKIFILATMGLYSGDGAGCGERLLKKKDANITGGLHIKMPDCVADSKLLKKSYAENNALIKEATQKIKVSANKYQQDSPTKEGLSFFNHIGGLFGQRLWFYNKTRTYKNEPTINRETCVTCSKCVVSCPTKNLRLENNQIVTGDRCTLCYRCVNGCPKQSLTILGEQVIEQVYFNKFKKDEDK